MVIGEPLRILLVEDNEDHAELVLRNLAQHRIANTIVHVKDGAEALDYLRRQGEYSDPSLSIRPNLVILDLRLPKVDGLEVLRQMKESEGLRRIPVVVLTTSAAERDLALAYDYHANSYLVKPLDFENFKLMMEQLGLYWLACNQQPQTDDQ